MILKPFQDVGVAFLAERTRALLADEPGVGKTPQLIVAAQRVGAKRIGVVCPSIAVRHWEREFAKWGYGGKYDIVPWHLADGHPIRKTRPHHVWDVLIPDESHFGKNPQAQRTKAVFGKGGLGWYASRIWAASGTPAPNNAAELWPMLFAFGKTTLDPESFKMRYCRVGLDGKVLGNNPTRLEELRGILKSFSLRRRKVDVLPELGEIDVQELYVEPSPEALDAGDSRLLLEGGARDLMDALAGKSSEEMLIMLAGDKEYATVRRYSAMLKVPAVAETVAFEVQNGLADKLVIFAYHVDAMYALQDRLRKAGVGCIVVSGRETDKQREQRDARIESWKRDKRTPVLIASIGVAATALDFTVAHQGIMLEMDWVPGNNLQAMQRMHRHGQDKPVTIRVAIGTPCDEVVSDVLIRKTRDLAQIFD